VHEDDRSCHAARDRVLQRNNATNRKKHPKKERKTKKTSKKKKRTIKKTQTQRNKKRKRTPRKRKKPSSTCAFLPIKLNVGQLADNPTRKAGPQLAALPALAEHESPTAVRRRIEQALPEARLPAARRLCSMIRVQRGAYGRRLQ